MKTVTMVTRTKDVTDFLLATNVSLPKHQINALEYESAARITEDIAGSSNAKKSPVVYK